MPVKDGGEERDAAKKGSVEAGRVVISMQAAAALPRNRKWSRVTDRESMNAEMDTFQ